MNIQIMKDAIKRYGTPLYLYDVDTIFEQYNKLRYILQDKFEILYSMKTNPLIGINQVFKRLGCGVEIASKGELYSALSAGFKPQDIIFTSPGKTYDELEYSIDSDIYSINIESIEEAIIINEIASKKSKQVNIAIRVNPDFNVSGARIKMTGVASQFGIDQCEIEEAFKIIKSLSNINVIGIHIYMGTQILNEVNIIANFDEIIKFAIETSEIYKFKLEFLDLGGGFGIPYFNNEKELDVEVLKNGINQVWERYSGKLNCTKLVVESGRFLMAESGVYLTKIIYKKHCKDKIYLVCDGGSNQNASSAFLGRYIRNNFPLSILDKYGDTEEVNIVGPLCTPTDVIGQKVSIVKAEVNDILVVEKSGAYGLSHSPTMFLSHPLPAEVISYNNKYHVLRERGKVEDFLKGQAVLSKEIIEGVSNV